MRNNKSSRLAAATAKMSAAIVLSTGLLTLGATPVHASATIAEVQTAAKVQTVAEVQATAAAQMAAGVTGGWTPDPWVYCYNTVTQPGWGWKVSYAGIYSNPYYNSYYTNCRDLWRGDNVWWYSARRVDWYRACQMTYGSRSSSYQSGDRMYCWRW